MHTIPFRHLRTALCGLSLATSLALPAHALVLTQLPGVVASASSCYLNAGCSAANDWSAAKILDGRDYDLTGRYAWSAGNHGTAGAPAWVRLDLGALYSLESAELRFTYNNGGWNGYSNVYQLRASADASNWVVVASGTLVDSSNPAAVNNTFAWAAGSGPVARYVEYRVIGGTHWAALGDMRLEGVSAVPEAGSASLLLVGLLALSAVIAKRRG